MSILKAGTKLAKAKKHKSPLMALLFVASAAITTLSAIGTVRFGKKLVK